MDLHVGLTCLDDAVFACPFNAQQILTEGYVKGLDDGFEKVCEPRNLSTQHSLTLKQPAWF